MTTPAVEVRSFQVTIPANTLPSAPATVDIAMPPREVQWVHWVVPPGAAGNMGWSLTMSDGQPVIPTGGGYIVTDADSDTWQLAGLPDSGAWEVTGYNEDVFDHSVYLYFGVSLPPLTAPAAGLSSNASLSSSPPANTTPG